MLVYLAWKAEWWIKRQSLRDGISTALVEGLAAYTHNQSAIQLALWDHFREVWSGSLSDSDMDTQAGDPATITPGAAEEEEEDSDEEKLLLQQGIGDIDKEDEDQ